MSLEPIESTMKTCVLHWNLLKTKGNIGVALEPYEDKKKTCVLRKTNGKAQRKNMCCMETIRKRNEKHRFRMGTYSKRQENTCVASKTQGKHDLCVGTN